MSVFLLQWHHNSLYLPYQLVYQEIVNDAIKPMTMKANCKIVFFICTIILYSVCSYFTQGQGSPKKVGKNLNTGTECGGTERWDVKLLTDPLANTVNFTPVQSTVAQLVKLATPKATKTMKRKSPVETTTYTITCNITLKKSETDKDYHLVLMDGDYHMIGEIPDPACPAAAKSHYLKQFIEARKFVEDNIGNGNVPKVKIARVVITGVGFIDPPHGQTGAAPNNLELHPILDIHFLK